MTMEFNTDKPSTVACLVFKRADGHELSLSSMSKSMIEFDTDDEIVTDHGNYTSAAEFLRVVEVFKSVEDSLCVFKA